MLCRDIIAVYSETHTKHINTLFIIIIIIIIIITAIELSLGGSSPYTSTDKTNKNKYTKIKQYEKYSTNNTKYGKHKYTYYQNTHPPTHTHPHLTKQVKTTTVQDTHQMK
jgi:hypothetical protein